MDLAVRVDRVDPVGQVAPDPVDRAATDLADPAVPEARAITDPADPVTTDLVTTDPADPVITAPVDRVDLATTGPVVPAPHGTAMTTAATSTTLRGGTDPHPGALASHRDRDGTGHFRRPVDRGTTGRSTIGVTRKRLSGTRSSTSSASTSSEFGSRCKDSPPQTPAPPIGGGGRCPFASRCTYPSSNALPTTRCTLGDNAQILAKSPKSSVTLGKWRRCGRCNQGAP